jgi:hypothetical protein
MFDAELRFGEENPEAKITDGIISDTKPSIHY